MPLIVAESTTGIAIVSLGFIAGGYVLLVLLWYAMVYRPSREERRGRAESSREPQP